MSGDVILVGVDGSPGASDALRWALLEASLRGCAVEVITTFQPDDQGSVDDARVAAEATQQAAIDDAAASRETMPAVSRQVTEGSPAELLIYLSGRAELMVLGSHGTESIRHSALGSVGEACVRLAECPVVVVPHAGRAAPAGDDIVAP
jgi:nucleotide-binding universal stress UspA family protein